MRIRSRVDFPAPFAPTRITLEFGSMTQSSPTMLGLPASYEKFRFLMLTTGLLALGLTLDARIVVVVVLVLSSFILFILVVSGLKL